MKIKIRLVSIVLSSLLLLSACGSPQPQSNQTTANNNTNGGISSLYKEAVTILDEFADIRVDDFQKAYDLLVNIPDNEDDFIAQLDKANLIFEKYDVDFKYGGWYLQPYLSADAITTEGLDEYKTEKVFWDIENLLQATVYPTLFEKYGFDAEQIENLTYSSVVSAIQSTGEYVLGSKDMYYDGTVEEWNYVESPRNANYDYRFHYDSNGMVSYIDIPVVRISEPMDDTAYENFLALESVKQKETAENKFQNILNQWNTSHNTNPVLNQIYNEDEMLVIKNYLKSLLPEKIWENVLNSSDNYLGAQTWFQYKGNRVIATFGLNSLCLFISAANDVNQFSHKWHTVRLGFTNPSEDEIQEYRSYLEYDVAANSEVVEGVYNLDLNEEKYVGSDTSWSESDVVEMPVQTMVISMADEVEVKGIIEQNINAFPNYRLKLDTPVSIVFEEYGDDEIFHCEYLFFYNEPELNGGYDFATLVGKSCMVKATLEDYRGGEQLFFLMPAIQSELSNDNISMGESDNSSFTKLPFSKHKAFISDVGNTIEVSNDGTTYVFMLNGTVIGSDDCAVDMQGKYLFEVDADNGTYLITLMPNDENISLGVLGFLDTALEGEYYPCVP